MLTKIAHTSLLSFSILGLTVLAVGCNDVGTEPAGEDEVTAERTPLSLSFEGLSELGPDYVYEGWLIVDGAPISTGRFDADQASDYQADLDADAAHASTFVLTIEPRVGDDPAPSHVHVLGGDIGEDMTADLSVAHGAALGTDFSDAHGSYILETPTDDEAGNYANGVWFVDSLWLPTLPEGWVYEGWVVVDGTPISTGRFLDGLAADDDGAGPAAGSNGFPAYPGQDFVDPALNLIGGAVVITVEPEPDNDPAPFALKPLIDMNIEDLGPDHVAQNLVAQDTSPAGVAVLGR